MAAKLKNLKIRKVDFVEEGANPDAHIGIVKQKGGDKRSDESCSGREQGSILKKLFCFIGKAAGMEQSEVDSVIKKIQKGDAVSFHEKFNEVNNRKIADEMWDICYALQSSLCSILNDEEIDGTGAATAMQESLDEFYAVVQEAISKWSGGREASIVRKNEEVSETDLEIMKAAVERLNISIEKAGKNAEPKEISEETVSDNNENLKGDEKEMKIDKSKMTEAEKAFLESIEKRYGTDEGAGDNTGKIPAGHTGADVFVPSADMAPAVAKAASLFTPAVSPVQQADEADNIYKGLHPAVRAELEGLKKFREEAEERELAGIAKKYEITGKKQEELIPLLKSLRAAGGTAYNDMIALLDQTVDTIEKSGVFTEIGKSGHPGGNDTAEAKIESIAKSYMETDTGLSYTQAVAKAWEENPQLLAEYDEQANV